ncbi:MAG: hypothetical protein GC137_11045 [Alphaproteobacteria bacterium]|nr:hypothetical protein [Alphaproteobacteria bacterium]
MSNHKEASITLKNQHLRQAEVSLSALYRQAQAAQIMLQQKAEAILDCLISRQPEIMEGVRLEMGGLKKRDRAEGKIKKRYKGDVSQITDLLRCRFIVDTPEQIRALEQALRDEPTIAAIQNRFERPVIDSGYRNISSEIRLPNGHVAEIQIVQSDMLAVDQDLHSRMEKVQIIKRGAKDAGRNPNCPEKREIHTLYLEMRAISDGAAQKSRINELLDPDVRDRFAPLSDAVTAAPSIEPTSSRSQALKDRFVTTVWADKSAVGIAAKRKESVFFNRHEL